MRQRRRWRVSERPLGFPGAESSREGRYLEVNYELACARRTVGPANRRHRQILICLNNDFSTVILVAFIGQRKTENHSLPCALLGSFQLKKGSDRSMDCV